MVALSRVAYKQKDGKMLTSLEKSVRLLDQTSAEDIAKKLNELNNSECEYSTC
jgi:hypothetical protein